MTNKVKAGISTVGILFVLGFLFKLGIDHDMTVLRILLYVLMGILITAVASVIYMMIMDLVFGEEVPRSIDFIHYNEKPAPTIDKKDVLPPPRPTVDINNQQTIDELLVKYKIAVQDNTRLTLENERLRKKKSAM